MSYSKVLPTHEISAELHRSFNELPSIPHRHLRKLIRMGEYYAEEQRRAIEMAVAMNLSPEELHARVNYHKGMIDGVSSIVVAMRSVVEGTFQRTGDVPDSGTPLEPVEGDEDGQREYDEEEEWRGVGESFFDE